MQTNVTHDTSNKSSAADRGARPTPDARVLVPSVDVLESPDEILVLADLPGVHPEDLALHLENELLSLTAQRKSSRYGRAVQYARTFQVPSDLDTDGIEARCERGVLTLRFPRRASAKPRAIAVKSGG